MSRMVIDSEAATEGRFAEEQMSRMVMDSEAATEDLFAEEQMHGKP